MKITICPIVYAQGGRKAQSSIDLSRIAHLLREVQQGKTMQAAAALLGISYRSLWNHVKEAEKILNTQLLISTKGHGSILSPSAEMVLRLVNEVEGHFDEISQSQANRVASRLSELIHAKTVQWKLSSSSDPIIERILNGSKEIDYRTMGSGQALEQLLAGEADIAGFHLPNSESLIGVQAHLKKVGLAIYPLMRRMQGLIIQKGNPLKIKALHDLARPEVRFINRQKGAGTRLLLDTLMKKEGMAGDSIRGYRHEEFTHTAVATAILADAADVGLGLKYIASQFQLDFVLLEEETFYLAMKPKLYANPTIQSLAQEIRRLLAGQTGYKAVPPPKKSIKSKSLKTVQPSK